MVYLIKNIPKPHLHGEPCRRAAAAQHGSDLPRGGAKEQAEGVPSYACRTSAISAYSQVSELLPIA